MKRVYLLRHAKSSWKHPELPDRDRPLAGRGKRAAKAIVKHMRAQEFEPELVLCSTARRARETLERIEPALGRAPVRVEGELYGASARELLVRLRRLPDDVGSVLVIGHNPGMHELASELAGSAPELVGKFPRRRWPRSCSMDRTGASLGPRRPSWSSSSGRAICDANPAAPAAIPRCPPGSFCSSAAGCGQLSGRSRAERRVHR
jgi:phosphohistidine phosphatase